MLGLAMRMLDLFCGRFGWGKAFAARGWDVVGIDLVDPSETPERCEFWKLDILQLKYSGEFVGFEAPVAWLGQFDFICASSPCEQFSKWGMRCFNPNPAYPEIGISLFNHTRALCEASGVPYIMENVRAAQDFVGQAENHCGPFYLWGSAVPPLMPQGIIKGMTRRAIGHKDYKGQPGWNTKNISAGLRLREKDAAATAAVIPPELAASVVDYAERILEQRAVA